MNRPRCCALGGCPKLDIENMAEEIESMGRSERRELVSRLTVLFVHLLKWRYQPTYRGRSWRLTIEQQRIKLGEHLRESPSLKSQLTELMSNAYRLAKIDAAQETGLDRDSFPIDCPFTFDEAMNPDFWPN